MRGIVTDGDMAQIMYMRKTRFRQKYISMVHGFITKGRNSSKHVYALCLKKNITKNQLNAHPPIKICPVHFPVLLQMDCMAMCESYFMPCLIFIYTLINPTNSVEWNIDFSVYVFGLQLCFIP